MCGFLNNFTNAWNEYGAKHGLDTANKCIEHAVRNTIILVNLGKPSIFDWRRYIQDYPDLQRRLGKNGNITCADATCHYLNHGINENRKKFKLGTNEPYEYDFDWKKYNKLNPDVFTEHNRGETIGKWHCFRHWCEFGHAENRKTGRYMLIVDKHLEISTDIEVNKIWNEIINNVTTQENVVLALLSTNDDNIWNLIISETIKTFDPALGYPRLFSTINGGIDFSTDNIDNNVIQKIYNNIDDFCNFIKPYNNILFICSDYPGYGGAATNCNNLSTYLSNTHNVYSVYWNYTGESNVKYEVADTHCIVDQSNLESTIRTMSFKPNIVILKNSVNIKLKLLLKCPIIFLVPGIYKNQLDVCSSELDTIEKQNMYINQSTLSQIRSSDFSFCNSSHTQHILQKWYGLQTMLFYSSFIQYYGQTINDDPEFHKRKYQYGLIISNFNRKIKNSASSVEFLKDKTGVILIGKGSSKYKSMGFECIESIDNIKMADYYKQIKYIVQDGFYESCSNVMVESLFNGCKPKPVFIVSSTQYPGYGGAATNAYQIIKYIRNQGFKVAGVFFNDKLNVDHDPDKIGGIFLYLSNNYIEERVKQDVRSYLKSEPNYCLAKNYIAPLYCKKIFKCYTVYLVSGMNHFNLYTTTSALEMLNSSFIVNKIIREEIEANKICDSIIVNSELTHKIFTKIYPEFTYKLRPPIDTTFCIERLPETFIKNNDIILICSNFDRLSKNNLYLLNVLSNKNIDKYKKIIIGENSKLFENIANSVCLPLQIHKTCLEYMAKSKILLHPALYESNSNTIREAYYHKCLPITTRNVGYHELFPDFLICDSFALEEWINKVIYALENYEDVKNTVINFNTHLDLDNLLK